jgi:exodeoxyribonuclease V beta subunit
MKGYIDMVFEHDGRFYLVDWKSNFLGTDPENYNQTALYQTMQADLYMLQYHIYTLALHQYLRNRKAHYRYHDNFGGVFYIFIRGADPNHGAGSGIFYDLPEPEIVHQLGRMLIPGYKK